MKNKNHKIDNVHINYKYSGILLRFFEEIIYMLTYILCKLNLSVELLCNF